MLNEKEQTRQKLLWYSFWFIVSVTLLGFIAAWFNKDLSGINDIINTAIGALSIWGIGNLATKPGRSDVH
jgi:uncharacterized RDD family membrane protein YckC